VPTAPIVIGRAAGSSNAARTFYSDGITLEISHTYDVLVYVKSTYPRPYVTSLTKYEVNSTLYDHSR
jgi:hypothetical protein